jgi:hypothetical protein
MGELQLPGRNSLLLHQCVVEPLNEPGSLQGGLAQRNPPSWYIEVGGLRCANLPYVLFEVSF